jgi:hypothetical protein
MNTGRGGRLVNEELEGNSPMSCSCSALRPEFELDALCTQVRPRCNVNR